MITITVTDDKTGQEMKMTITDDPNTDQHSVSVKYNPSVDSDRPNDLWGAVQHEVVQAIINLGE